MTDLAAGLAVVAALLVWPVPALLARSRAALRNPVTALLLWQGIGLATGLCAIGAGLAYGLDRSGPAALRYPALAAAGLLAGYLLAVAGWVAARTMRQRRRHRWMLDLVGTPMPALPGGRLLRTTAAMAYSLPGLRPRMVLTSGAIASLSPHALNAVLAHERAHLRARHDLVILPFVAWQTALPFLPSARTARATVALLIEALADDAARTEVGTAALGEALDTVTMLSGIAGDATAARDCGPTLAVRLARLDGAAIGSL